jgi:hypothetical protein
MFTSCVNKRFLSGIVCGLVMLVAQVTNARAGSLELLVTESGGPTIPILDGSVFDLSPPGDGVITVDTSLLNLLLVNFKFSDLSALSNSLMGGTTASLSQTGTAQLLFGAPASTLTVTATDVDYAAPSGTVATLKSSTSETFTHTDAGNNQTFQSWYNPIPFNFLGATDVPSALLKLTSSGAAPNSDGKDAPDTLSPSIVPFGMTDTMIISLSGGTSAALAKDQFTGSTTLTASSIPEPASMALMVIGLPLTVFGIRYRRRRAA